MPGIYGTSYGEQHQNMPNSLLFKHSVFILVIYKTDIFKHISFPTHQPKTADDARLMMGENEHNGTHSEPSPATVAKSMPASLLADLSGLLLLAGLFVFLRAYRSGCLSYCPSNYFQLLVVCLYQQIHLSLQIHHRLGQYWRRRTVTTGS